MLELLRSLEWCVGGYCPKCEMSRGAGHSSDCRLDLAIRELASGESDVEYCLRAGPSYPVEPTVDEPIRIGSIVCPKPVPYKGTVWRVDRIERGRAYMTRVDQPAADYRVEAVFPVEDVVAAEPTVDEMARDVRPTFADKLRALGLPTEMEHNGMYCHDHRGPALWIAMGEWVYSLGPHVGPGPRRWPTAEAAVDELYAEWVAKQQAALGARPDSPPTDPSALAAWLYARVVPGRTVVERGGEYKAVVRSVARGRRCIILTGPDGDQVTAPGTLNLHLLNPDGTVLWEAK